MKAAFTSRNGFAVLTAVVVLAILGMLAIAAANSVQFTFSYASRSATQTRLKQSLGEGAVLLSQRSDMLKSVEGGTIVTLFAGGDANLPQVTAGPGQAAEVADLGETLPPLQGDNIVVLNAAHANPRAPRLSAVYLINAGQRPAPILLREMQP